jgi:hypothetical protein
VLRVKGCEIVGLVRQRPAWHKSLVWRRVLCRVGNCENRSKETDYEIILERFKGFAVETRLNGINVSLLGVNLLLRRVTG